MNTKPLTILLIFTFLFFLTGNRFVFGQEPEVKKAYWGSGDDPLRIVMRKGSERVTERGERGQSVNSEY